MTPLLPCIFARPRWPGPAIKAVPRRDCPTHASRASRDRDHPAGSRAAASPAIARSLPLSVRADKTGSMRHRRPAFVRGRKRACRRTGYSSSASPLALTRHPSVRWSVDSRGRRDEGVRLKGVSPLPPGNHSGLAFPAPLAVFLETACLFPKSETVRDFDVHTTHGDCGDSGIAASMPRHYHPCRAWEKLMNRSFPIDQQIIAPIEDR
jgi:hypothetical protein